METAAAAAATAAAVAAAIASHAGKHCLALGELVSEQLRALWPQLSLSTLVTALEFTSARIHFSKALRRRWTDLRHSA